jgi:predicted RNA-binding Zn-ribbon protein involved in translation (DUF1610 family)
MNQQFQHRNDKFICLNCGQENFPAQKTCRNHCTKCLNSLHVDNFPGDRLNNCQGKLVPISIDFKGGEMDKIIFSCAKCGEISRNKIAEDDNREALFQIIEKNNEQLKKR